jgi:hypothetical protein
VSGEARFHSRVSYINGFFSRHAKIAHPLKMLL